MHNPAFGGQVRLVINSRTVLGTVQHSPALCWAPHQVGAAQVPVHDRRLAAVQEHHPTGDVAQHVKPAGADQQGVASSTAAAWTCLNCRLSRKTVAALSVNEGSVTWRSDAGMAGMQP